MPIAKDGMLFMKKLAKCSAATMINTSGRAFSNALFNREYPTSRREYRSGSARSLRDVMPGPWLQTPTKTRLIAGPHKWPFAARRGSFCNGQRGSELGRQGIGAYRMFTRNYRTDRRATPDACR